jgi:hypothetical protein
MTKTLRFKSDADFRRLTWSRLGAHGIPPFCSICFARVPDTAIELCRQDGACAQLCDECARNCMETVDE